MTLQVHRSVSLSPCFSVVPIVLTKGGGGTGDGSQAEQDHVSVY
jgi:hypothetical protein